MTLRAQTISKAISQIQNVKVGKLTFVQKASTPRLNKNEVYYCMKFVRSKCNLSLIHKESEWLKYAAKINYLRCRPGTNVE